MGFRGQPLVVKGEPNVLGARRRVEKLAELLQEPMHYIEIIAAVTPTLYAPLNAPTQVCDIASQELVPGSDETWCWGFMVHSAHRRNRTDPVPTLACSEQVTVAMTVARQIRIKGATSIICDPMNYQMAFRLMNAVFGQQDRPTMVRCIYRALPTLNGDPSGHGHSLEAQGTMVGGFRKGGRLTLAIPLVCYPGQLGVPEVATIGSPSGQSDTSRAEFVESPRAGTGQEPSLRAIEDEPDSELARERSRSRDRALGRESTIAAMEDRITYLQAQVTDLMAIQNPTGAAANPDERWI